MAPESFADNDNTLIPNNKRLNDGVVANVYTVQHQAGCIGDIRIEPRLQRVAQWHANDVLGNRDLDGHIGTDGSTPQNRADAAGYEGQVAETLMIHPAIAVTGIDVINQWYHDPIAMGIMSDCANTDIGVWSENSLDRTVVVAVYGRPRHPVEHAPDENRSPGSPPIPIGPTPDYDASDELEFGLRWLPWILRGVYPPPGYQPN
ncbi:MAG: CAP domain-containing protein [Mycolicibacter algericus]